MKSIFKDIRKNNLSSSSYYLKINISFLYTIFISCISYYLSSIFNCTCVTVIKKKKDLTCVIRMFCKNNNCAEDKYYLNGGLVLRHSIA